MACVCICVFLGGGGVPVNTNWAITQLVYYQKQKNDLQSEKLKVNQEM